MATRYTVTIRCDERTSPDCQERFVRTSDELRATDRMRQEALDAGWFLGYRMAPDGGATTYDVCPACARLAGEPTGWSTAGDPGT